MSDVEHSPLQQTNVYLKKVDEFAITPTKGTPYAAGSDLYANHDALIQPGMVGIVKTGISVEIPTGTVAMICSRSGLAAKQGIFVLNAPGLIDSDYRGELAVILANFSMEPLNVTIGDRIAQLMLMKYLPVRFMEVETLMDTDRGDKGFGSTGVSIMDALKNVSPEVSAASEKIKDIVETVALERLV